MNKWGRFNRHSKTTAIDKFMKRVRIDDNTGCWIWTGAIGSHKRYGIVGLMGKSWLAHRASWLLFKGVDPEKYCVCHKCDNGFCVNPEHLFLGTQGDNVRDMESKKRAKHPSCEKHHKAKLTRSDVETIRLRYASENISARKLAIEFNVNRSTISRIVKNKGWNYQATPASPNFPS